MGRPVSLGEVFLRTHTRADGTFVDDKAKLIAEAYKKNLQERISEMDADDMDDASSEQPTTLPLSIEERNELFLQVYICLHFSENGFLMARFVVSIVSVY